MSGHNAFNQMVTDTTAVRMTSVNHIKPRDYEQWKKLYTFEGICGIRYGESFCSHFGIVDNILKFSLTASRADTYIEETYIERS